VPIADLRAIGVARRRLTPGTLVLVTGGTPPPGEVGDRLCLAYRAPASRLAARRFHRIFVGCFAATLAASALPALEDPAAAGQPASIPVPVVAAAPAANGSIDESWASATRVTLDRDFTNRRAAGEPTSVAIAQDGSFLDIAFDVTQHEEFVESTETNGSSVTSDDYVGVYLSPNGPLGFQYAFFANPRGARYQTSSENSAYTPQWSATTKRTTSGYTVTMRIPLGVIRSGGLTNWRAQFVRATVHANALDVWAYDEHASSVSDATYFGTIEKIGAAATTTAATRPRPRAQIYGLGEATSRAFGGDTSRLGADLALPVTPTASLLASLHPDFSNVETDQQTIAPTAFAHQFVEVRPFFTQAASSFNFNVASLNAPVLLYTPVIPTFRDGYALEGTQGAATFGAFDAVGANRNDAAETVNYNISTPVHSYGLNLQNVDVNGAGGLHDDLSSATTGYANPHSHEVFFLNYAAESGATVTNPRLATYLETGAGYATATTQAFIFYEGIGSQFAPADSFVQQNDIAGLNGFLSETIPFKPNTILHDIAVTAFGAGLRDEQGTPSQNDAQTQINFDFSNLITVHTYYNQSAVRTFANQLLPFDASGFLAGYKFATNTPTYIQYQGGPYYHGNLDAWTYLTTLKVAPRLHLTLEQDEDQYLSRFPGEMRTNQWLERASLDFQASRETQFDLGVRRVIGSFLPTFAATPNFAPVTGGNISAALHFLASNGKSEFYAVYGDPNSFSTTPAIFLKYIRYIGAPKGT